MFSMISELDPETQALMAAILVGAIVLVVGELLRINPKRRVWGKSNRSHEYSRESGGANTRSGPWFPRPAVVSKPITDAADQLRIVMAASFSARPLLNRQEARVFQELKAIVAACNPHWLVMAQVSLGEILKSQSYEAYSCINSKRVDLLLVDENCHPRHVIEYQGHGHHQGTAAARDAVKKEALRRAGIGYHEVVAGQTTPSELTRLVQKLVGSPTFAQPNTQLDIHSVKG